MRSEARRFQRGFDRHLMNVAQMKRYRPEWDWKNMKGSAACLKWSYRDLINLDKAIALTPNKRLAIQAGGNLGIFPKRMAEEFEVVHTFEPDPVLFKCLRANAREPNIVAHQKAIGNSNDPVSMSCRRRDRTGKPEHEGLSHVAGRGDIPQVRIDDLGFTECGLIYLDIEGYELFALQGARQTILRHRPVITVEINKNIGYYGRTREEIRDWIMMQGYRFITRSHSDEVFTPC